MRARGAKVTDIAVLVVAADDGVMPQTKRVDLARARRRRADRRRRQQDRPARLEPRPRAQRARDRERAGGGVGRRPSRWPCVSAKKREDLDDLLERILLVADAELDLRANPSVEASGPIVESRLDVGRGPVATLLVHRGTLRVGDAIVAGDAWGRVRALYDYRGERLQEAGPGEPVEILGFDRPPPAGELAARRRERAPRPRARASARRAAAPRGDREAVEPRRLARQALRADAGGCRPGSEPRDQGRRAGLRRGDRLRARQDRSTRRCASTSSTPASAGSPRTTSTSRQRRTRWWSASTCGRPPRCARWPSAQGIEIRLYRVIYQLTEEIEQALVGMLSPVETEAILGEVEVRALFKVSRLGTIAGCMVTSGVVRRGASVRLFRDGTRIHETTVAQLRRFKDDAREVTEGFECGILLDGLQRPARGRRVRGVRDA